MYGEFSFRGRSCTEFDLHYIPDEGDLFPAVPEWKMTEEEVTGRKGGYFYGTSVGIRTFEQPVYFEEATRDKLEEILRWLDRRAEGELIFDDRPFVSYTVRPEIIKNGKAWWNEYVNQVGVHGSGTMTIRFKAYQPYGKMLSTTLDDVADDEMRLYSGAVKQSMMPDAISAEVGDYLVYNPGTENISPIITLEGSAPNGQTFTNLTNGTTCSLQSFTLSSEQELVIDGEIGLVATQIGTERTPAFEYHLDGFLNLEPCTPYYRNVFTSTKADSAEIAFQLFKPTKEIVGLYIFLEGAWRRIIAVNENHRTAQIDAPNGLSASAASMTMIAKLNLIRISGEDLALSGLKFEYTPLLR